MALGRLLYTATRLEDGRVLVAGGFNLTSEVYDPAVGTWSRTDDTRGTHRYHTATRLEDGRVLLAGGQQDWQPGSSVELYDPASGRWSLAGGLVTHRSHHAAVLLPSGKVLVMGGADSSGAALSSAELYEPATGTWTLAGAMSAARREHTATLLPSGKVLVTGGSSGAGTLGTAELYDPATGTWEATGSMGVARRHHTATLLPSGKVLVTGSDSSTWTPAASAELYDPATGTWEATGSMGAARRYHTATLLPSGKVLVAGGFHEYTGISFASELYDPATGAFSPTASMSVDRYGHTASLLEDGTVLAVGGFTNHDPAAAELYVVPVPARPIANAGTDVNVFLGTAVQLDGRGSHDSLGRPLTYRWTLSGPPGSTATLGNAETATPTFVPDLFGPYLLELVVNNGVEDSAPDTVTVTSMSRGTLTLSSGPDLLTRDTGTLSVTLDTPGGDCRGQWVGLASNDPLVVAVPSSVTIPQVPDHPVEVCTVTFTVTTQTLAGSAVLTAFKPGFRDGTSPVRVRKRGMALVLSSSLVGSGRTTSGTLKLSAPAPEGGVTVALSTNANAVATLSPSSLHFEEGEDTKPLSVQAHVGGQAIFTARAEGFDDATAHLTVSAGATINLPIGFEVAPGQELSFPISLSAPAPAGGLTVLLTSSAPGVARVAPATVFIPEGMTAPGSQPTVKGLTRGTADISARDERLDAPEAYAPDTRAVEVRLSQSFSPATLSVPVDNTAFLTLNLSAPAPAGGVTVDLWMDGPLQASAPGTVTFNEGQSQVTIPITGLIPGTTVLRALGAGMNQATALITVTLAPTLHLDGARVGRQLRTSMVGSLSSPAPAGNLQVTLTSTDASKVLLASTREEEGRASITLQVDAGSSGLPPFYVHGLAGSGTVELTATAPGYARATATVTLRPSGFFLLEGDFTTTAASPDRKVRISVAMLEPATLAVDEVQPLRPGASASVHLGSSDETVGVAAPSPVLFHAGDSQGESFFDPIGGGATTLAVVQPEGFNAPSSRTALTATVTAPGMSLTDVTLGKELQEKASGGFLAAPAPAGNLQVTISSLEPDKVLLSTQEGAMGTERITFQLAAGSTVIPEFHVQALAGAGTALLRVTAPGYTATTGRVNLVPSGVRLLASCPSGWCESTLSTTSLSPNSSLMVVMSKLDPITLRPSGSQKLRPGVEPVPVNVTSSNPSVGVITSSPVLLASGQDSATTHFDPLEGGTTTLSLHTPEGFSTPSSAQQVVATVTAPSLTLSPVTIGKDLQVSTSATLGAAAPAGNVRVTLTVQDPSKALLSTSETTPGSSSISVIVFATRNETPTFYVQALAGSGTVQYTASAPGYTSATGTLTLTPSGVGLHAFSASGSPTSLIITNTLAGNSALRVVVARLDPVTLGLRESQNLRPGVGPVQVGVVSGNPSVGVITNTSVTIASGQGSADTAFDPLGAGTSTLSAVTPEGFTSPSTDHQVVATVTVPSLTLLPMTIGKDLQEGTEARLGANVPAGGVTMTLTVADPSKALLSTSKTTPGSSSITLPISAGQTLSPTFYVQALAGSGTVQYTASAPGYTSATGTLTLTPSGAGVFFRTSSGTLVSAFSTNTLAGNTALRVVLARLDPTTLNFVDSQALRPGVGPVQVSVVSGNPTVGVITSSPVTLASGQDFALAPFTPLEAGTATVSAGTPEGFSSPSNGHQVVVTVTAVAGPRTRLNALTVGKDLQVGTTASLTSAAPAGGVTLTLTVADPSKALLSTSKTTLGSGSITLPIQAGRVESPTFYVQALAGSGTVQYTASAPGYTSSAGTLTLTPSGFVIPDVGESFTIHTAASDKTLTVHPASLDEVTLNFKETQQLRPGLSNVVVTVSSEHREVGTITLPQVVFQGADEPNHRTTSFHPEGAGSTVIVVSAPGFSQASNNNFITAHVTH